MGYVGNQQAEGFVQRPTKQDLTGATGTSLTLSHAVSKEEDIDLYINNVKQEPTTAYTVADTAVTLTGSVVATDDIYVVYNSLALQTVTPPDGSVTSAKLVYPLTTFSSTGIDDNATSTAMTLDSSGNVGIGTTSPSYSLDVKSVGEADIRIDSATGNDGALRFAENGTNVFTMYHDASNSALAWYDNSNLSERMRIDSSGRFYVGTTDGALYNNTSGNGFLYDATGGSTQMLRDGGAALLVNRASSDGSIVVFYQNGTPEGSISVSGTTVSFNGGHLARWSRLADNNKDTSIVKGTVMTNLDEMVEWGDEDNEQLNKMAVSSVEGDVNVSGVFVNWDEDDDWNDMNIAMTGDMVIRIAQGTTVQRGDLLMSAGDGTAKPQGDDIVRSKTIAKVTSTSVSHTYDDGTYLVPCVLMAC